MASKRAIIRQLQEELGAADAELRRLAPLIAQAYEMQVTIAALLERLTPDGAAILPQDLRQQAIDGEWGYETMIVETEPDKPMIVRLRKQAATKLRFPDAP